MKQALVLLLLAILPMLVSCDSMLDDKIKSLQNNSLLMFLNPSGRNTDSHYAVSGRVANNGTGVAGVTITVIGSAGESLSAVTDSSGEYSIDLPASGNYTVTPSGNGYTMDPKSRSLLVEGRVADVNFSASSGNVPDLDSEYMISGKITNGGAGVSGISVAITDGEGVNISVVTGTNGMYSAGLASPGNYTVTPAGGTYHIYPESKVLSIDGKMSDVNFSAGASLWGKTYGTDLNEEAYAASRTSDGGYVIAGYGYSATSGIVSCDGRIVKVDAGGNVIWDNYFGGSGEDKFMSIIETTDGNYVAAGYTTSKGNGAKDAWVIKIDPNGVLVPDWDLTFGGTGDDEAKSIIQNSSGGYVFTGMTHSLENMDNAYAVGIDNTGAVVFEKSFGGTKDDSGNAVLEAETDAYIISGYSKSYGAGDMDSWVFKIDGAGEIMKVDGVQDWNFVYAKTGNDSFSSMAKDGNGGYVLAGYSTSPSNSLSDFRMVRISSTGVAAWDYDTRYSNDDGEALNSICASPDGGFITVGRTMKDISFGEMRIIKIDADGTKLWQKTYGGPDDDSGFSIIPGYDSSFLIAGYMTNYLKKTKDFWVINVDGNGEYTPH